MTEEIIKRLKDSLDYEFELSFKDRKQLLDYITNLQQGLDKANDIIQKDRQFYKCRMDEYVELKKENEELKQTLHNITINGVEEENTTVLDLIKENERLNNIINELEAYICAIEYDERFCNEKWQIAVRIHNKLKELKESGNNE